MRIAMLITLMAVLTACSVGPDLRVDRDPSADLKTSRTFGFYDRMPPDQARYSAIMSQRLKDATRITLESHGYRYMDQYPDLWVNFFVQQRTTLRVDLVDAKRQAVVWRGVAEGRIGEEARANSTRAIDLVVWELFVGFPQAQTRL